VVPTPKFATFFNSLPNALPGSHFYLHFNPMPPLLQALFFLTHVGTANRILDLAKKANTTFQLATGTLFNTAITLYLFLCYFFILFFLDVLSLFLCSFLC
jgi:hypothetical protein